MGTTRSRTWTPGELHVRQRIGPRSAARTGEAPRLVVGHWRRLGGAQVQELGLLWRVSLHEGPHKGLTPGDSASSSATGPASGEVCMLSGRSASVSNTKKASPVSPTFIKNGIGSSFTVMRTWRSARAAGAGAHLLVDGAEHGELAEADMERRARELDTAVVAGQLDDNHVDGAGERGRVDVLRGQSRTLAGSPPCSTARPWRGTASPPGRGEGAEENARFQFHLSRGTDSR